MNTPSLSLVRRLSQAGTWLTTWFMGVAVGADDFGNRYYRERRPVKNYREKRWVIYAGEPEASKVPPEWHIWLHHTAEAPIAVNSPLRKVWQKPYQPNMTGTLAAYHPPGHVLEGGKRQKATGDYQAWTPQD
jgi:NADH:ubiquinone oxidoreductase subunit